ncbi:hypothetical protein DMC30DRAFT_51975 [Rhodotorula diobovata]|uniref:Peptidase M20 dimerisation domain-containing protein n=1 Tax=Rhodotorula diobovata TaxID=5288 RepID=A0A5C5FRV1_9BASI|nr:hypothetical protein DMC30DRAFT_51975 [Rhodotorula diobovata]
MGKPEVLPLAAEPLPTSTSSPPPTRSTSTSRARLAALLVLLPLAFWLSFPRHELDHLSWRAPTQGDRPVSILGASCPVQTEPKNVGPDWRPEQDDAYKQRAIERLQGAVRIPTESYDDMAGPEDPRFDIMGDLHGYLEKTFPRVWATLDVETVQKWGLLLTWKGSDDKLKPVVLMAHQDVVPVNPSTVDQWTYPPFDAHLDESGWIWGRGTADCKNTLIGLFAALDKLIEDDFKPSRTIILSSGFDEEIGGHRSAAYLASTLESRYGKDGVALVLDEGFTGVDTAYGVPFARFGMAEKGAVSVKLEVLTTGGHSSVPLSAHTGIGVLAQCITALEAHPSEPLLQTGNPMLQQLQCAADHGEVDKSWRRRIRNPKQWKKLGREMAREDPIMRAFLGTTQAVDLIEGGVKLNALPEYAAASVNYRIDFLSTVNETLERISSILEPVVAALNLTFSAYGSHKDVDNNVVRLSMVDTSAIESAPLTPTDGGAWDLMTGTTRHIWPGAVVAPSGMIANTDTKYSWPLSRNIYRFVPGSLELIKAFHTVDERIHIDAHLSGIRFFYKLLRNTEGWQAE